MFGKALCRRPIIIYQFSSPYSLALQDVCMKSVFVMNGTFAKSDITVAIVGGGLGGVSAAFGLSRAGYSVHIFERAARSFVCNYHSTV
jgi:ribosomal protein S9